MAPNKRLLVHALKGNRAQIILAFLFAGCAMDTKEVMEWTGLSKPTADDGLKALKGMGLLGTQSLAHNRTVWLPAGDMLELQIQNFFISGPRGGSSSNQLIGNDLLLQPEVQIQKSFASGNVIDVEENPADPEILKALDEAKIREPKRGILARLEHVTVELIKGHVATAPNKSLAIYRIEHDWEVIEPETKSVYSLNSLICETCHTHPCECEEHDIECSCIKCRQSWSTCKKGVNQSGNYYLCEKRCADGMEFCSEHGGADWERPDDE